MKNPQNLQRILKLAAIASWIIAIVWFIVSPGYDQLLAILAGITAWVSAIIVENSSTEHKSGNDLTGEHDSEDSHRSANVATNALTKESLPRTLVESHDATTLTPGVLGDPQLRLLYDSLGVISADALRYLEILEDYVRDRFSSTRYIELSSQPLEKTDIQTRLAFPNGTESVMEKRLAERFRAGRKFTVIEAISHARKIAILGEPGIGKTTELLNAILAQVQTCRSQPMRIPIWASLADWGDVNTDVERFIWSSSERFWAGTNIDFDKFVALLHAGAFSIYLDGLNELPQRGRPGSDLRDEVEKKYERVGVDPREESIIKLAESSRSHLILSCRTFDYSFLPGWRVFEVIPLNEEQIAEFVRRNLGNEELYYEMLEQNPSLKSITDNPFLLRSLIDLIAYGLTKTIRDRFELVQLVYTHALEKESERLGLSSEAVLRSIGELSLALMRRGIIGSSFNIHRDFWDSDLLPEEDDWLTPGTLKCCQGAGILLFQGAYEDRAILRYRHQLVQESLALHYLEATSTSDAKPVRANTLVEVGRTHMRWGLLSEATDNFDSAYDILLEGDLSQSKHLRAEILLNQCKIFRQRRETAKGIEYARQALEIVADSEPSSLLADIHHELGTSSQRLKWYSDAERYYTLALATRRELGNSEDIAYEILYGLADFYGGVGLYNPDAAWKLYEEALEFFEKSKDNRGIARVKLRMAHFMRLTGRLSIAEVLFRSTVEYSEQATDHWMNLGALQFWGITLRDIHQLDKALEISHLAYRLAQKLSDEDSQISILIFNLAWISSLSGKHLEAAEYVKKAMELAEEQLSRSYRFDVLLKGYGLVMFRAKKFVEAAQFYIEADTEMDEEYRLHLGLWETLALWWAKKLGIHAGSNQMAVACSHLVWTSYIVLGRVSRPDYWFGRRLFRLNWRLRRHVWSKPRS